MDPVSPPHGPRPILVVDDEAPVRRLIFALLTEEGYAVTEAPDGAVALACVDAAAPSLILLDMRMPRMDGWEFARRYRARPGPHAPLVCITAAVDAAARGAQIGAVATVSKPFDLNALLEVVRRYAHPSPDSGRRS